MMTLLLALDFVAPMIGGAVLAGAVSFFGGVLLAKRDPDEIELPLDERRMQGLENEVQRLHRERGAARDVVEQQSRELHSTQVKLDLKSIVSSQTESPLEVLERFAARLGESVSADRVSIYFVARRSGEELQPIVQSGQPIPVGTEMSWQHHEQVIARTAIQSELGHYYNRDDTGNPLGESLIGSAAALPIRVNGRVLGALCLTRRACDQTFAEHQILIDFAADTLSQTLRRVFDEATIRRQARHDHLTDLVNRRSFDAYLETEIERVKCSDSRDCSLILADLDSFKSYNDRYGHPAGDHILREVARVLADQVSRLRLGERSIVARYGGEEFAILLPGVGRAGALRIAEGIRTAIEHESITIQNISVQITISIGVANCPLDAKSAESLVTAADKALYLAKSNGRNRVCQATELNRATESLSAPGTG